LLLPDLSLPADVKSRDAEGKLLWLAANVNIKSDKFFELLEGQEQAGEQPLVTVYMVTYNAEKFIAKAIDSILSQVYKNFELLVVDDGSTDKTEERVAAYSDDRIRYIYKEHKNYASGANIAIAEAKGKYVMAVDSDDFIVPDYIEKMVAFAEKHPQVDYFYPARFTLVNESGGLTSQQWDYMDFSDNSVLPAFLFRNCYGPIPNPGSLKRKTLFDKVELYDEVDTVEDFVFLCKNALKINFKRVDEHSTYFYRRHQQSNSLKFEARNRIMADALNGMVSIYPAEVLYPQIADVSDAALKERQYYKYVVETFCRHANGPMAQFGRYFQKYAEYYRSKLLRVAIQEQLAPK
jgi:glycosyltransferase involved in cell wall biosynthesis